MTGKNFKETIKKGGRVYGTLIVSTSPKWIEVIDQLDLDFVFIDTEHIPIDRQQLSWMCYGYAGKGMLPLVRIPSPDPYQACMVLDGGAKGIVVPYVETAEEIIQLNGAVKTRPIKGRKLQNLVEGKTNMEPKLKEYIQRHNEEHILIVNIESRPAIENLDEILEVPGLDGILIGPHDLTCNLGIPEQYDHAEFLDVVEYIITKAKQAGIGVGIHAFYEGSIGREIEWAQKGANVILHSGDINRFIQGVRKDINELKTTLGDAVRQSNSDINI